MKTENKKKKKKEKAPLPCKALLNWLEILAEPLGGGRAGRGRVSAGSEPGRQRCAPGAGSFPEAGLARVRSPGPCRAAGEAVSQGPNGGR